MTDAILRYHERTKHHFRRFAASLGYLDWATQPDAFRTFSGAETIPLPFDPGGAPVAFDDLAREGAVPPAPLDRDGVADLLLHSLAVSAWKQAGAARWALRVNPSSGNLHPTEGYAILPALPGIGAAPGVYHYVPDAHALERRASLAAGAFEGLTAGLPEGSFLVGLTSIHWREAWKYGERAFRYCQLDAGHAIAALRLAAALRGWRLRALSAWSHAEAGAALGVLREGDFPVPEEREEPEVVAAIAPAPIRDEPARPSPEVLDLVRGSTWRGRANRLSATHHPWPVIEAAAAATRHPGADPHPVATPAPFPDAPPGRPPSDARTLLRSRRSAVRMDEQGSVSADAFLRLLRGTLPDRPPFDATPFAPRVHLAIFVHRVDGLAPGLYLLARDPGAGPRLRAALRDDFAWERPDGVPEGFPLHRLAEADCRLLAARLSCAQAIAGESFFSLGMIAEFGGPIRERGARLWRDLFREAGAIGQTLYLGAEAEGARGTGIGCFFDDPVHEVLGLRGDAFQSLYHFTVGTPVEDTRLTTLPAFPDALRREQDRGRLRP